MKKTIVAGMLVLGLVAVGCDDGDDPTEAPPAVEVDDAADAVEQDVEEAADEVEQEAETKADEIEESTLLNLAFGTTGQTFEANSPGRS